MGVSRRGLLLGAGAGAAVVAAGGAGVATGVLPGRSTFYHRLGLDGPDGTVPSVAPGEVVSGVRVSAARGGREVGWALALPPGSDAVGLPLVVVLHGRGADHRTAFADDGLALHRFLAAAVADGAAGFALASVDGDATYWHRRADGDDAGAMVVDELVPLLGERGLDTTRLGFLGWSMGGFGALHLAGTLGAGRVRAVGAMSPALWEDYDATAPGAYDDAADFADVTVMGRQASLDGVAVRVDCGLGDPFADATQVYRDGFDEAPAGGLERGDHDLGYWRRVAPAHLAFLGSRW